MMVADSVDWMAALSVVEKAGSKAASSVVSKVALLADAKAVKRVDY